MLSFVSDKLCHEIVVIKTPTRNVIVNAIKNITVVEIFGSSAVDLYIDHEPTIINDINVKTNPTINIFCAIYLIKF